MIKRKCIQLIRYASTTAGITPSIFYKQLTESGSLKHDDYQLEVLGYMDELHVDLQTYLNKSDRDVNIFLSTYFKSLWKTNKVVAPHGLYIHGGVGCGKTMLLDLFYDCCPSEFKRRQHFHSFMIEIHKTIHKIKSADTTLKGVYDPITPVSEEISQHVRLLCLDEFQVTDIADAMILKHLFTGLFQKGVVLVASSNRDPDSLYKNGLQRSNFLPFISTLKNYCHVIHLNSGIDYRRLIQSKSGSDLQTYFVIGTDDLNIMAQLFKQMSSLETGLLGPQRLSVFGRELLMQKTKGEIVWCSFHELCSQPLAAADYMALAQRFHTLFLTDVPVLSLRDRSSLRRFITLIDTLYDHRCRLVISAERPVTRLFEAESHDEYHTSDSLRALRDDLGMKAADGDTTVSIFTGEEELFAHERTVSRLIQMRSTDYWNSARQSIS